MAQQRFEVGQSVWAVYLPYDAREWRVGEGLVDDIDAGRKRYHLKLDRFIGYWLREDRVFPTRAEAEAKLREEGGGGVGNL